MPTLYELCGVTPPTELNGVQAEAHRGRELRAHARRCAGPERPQDAVLRARLQSRPLSRRAGWPRRPSFVPWDPNRQEWDPDKATWELYNIDEDFSQANDLAQEVSGEAAAAAGSCGGSKPRKYNVLPLDWRATIRLNAEADGAPEPHRRPHDDDLLSGHHRPARRGVAADVQQVVDHHGGDRGAGRQDRGHDHHARRASKAATASTSREGKPTFVYNFLSVERMTFAAKERAAEGQDDAGRRLQLRRRRLGQGRPDHDERQRQDDRRAAG